MIAPSLLAVLSGFLAHWGIFIHGEWHLHIWQVVLPHIGVLAILHAIQIVGAEHAIPECASLRPFVLFGLYMTSLLSSIVIYRVFFHRLRHFNGPKLAAASKLWHVWKCRNSRGHHVLTEIHEKYGTFVRTGPAEVTVYHPGVFEAMDGPGTITPALIAIRQYHRRIVGKVNTLADLIGGKASQPILINEVMYWFSFDSMGDFAFSQDFEMMKNEQWHRTLWMFRYALALLGPFSPAIWVPRLAFAFIPGLWWAKWWFQMLEYCDKCMERRMKKTVPDKDIASFFIEEHKKSNDEKREYWLSGDTATLVVAGSDTNAPTLTHLFYFLTRYPQHAQKILKELQTLESLEDAVGLAKLSHLNGVINETMRLLPAVLTFGTRVTPPEVESAYARPHEFIPERWYSQPELVRDKRAFAPFGVGNTMCVGKNLALTQIRLVLATLISRYTFEFAPNNKHGEFLERDMKDQLRAQPGPCHVIFNRRDVMQ
ncbi:cytochrome P450 [Penicillium chermesinum]|nr:cytochrome P450 [Penicillium chermesinum]